MALFFAMVVLQIGVIGAGVQDDWNFSAMEFTGLMPPISPSRSLSLAYERPRPNTWLQNRFTHSLPYIYSGYLLGAALLSGPGWVGEAAWAYEGLIVGGLWGALVGTLATIPIHSLLKSEIVVYTLPALIAIGAITGQVWAVQKHQIESRRDRPWVRRGSAAAGLASGVGICLAFPSDPEYISWSWFLNLGLGAVVGYRLAWY